MEEPNPEDKDDNCVFRNLPAELHYPIFHRLDPPSVKSCRLVCSYWNSVLTNGRILTKAICTVYKPRNDRVTLWEYLKRYICEKLFSVDESQLPFLAYNSLRISEVTLSDCTKLNKWMNLYNLQNITCLELLECEIDVAMVARILKLTNLEELSLLDVEYAGFVNDKGRADPKRASMLLEIRKPLKKLRVRERNLWTLNPSYTLPMHRLDLFLKTLVKVIKNLEILTLECFDTGIYCEDNDLHYLNLFCKVFILLSRNSSTMKEFTLSTYDVKNGRRFNNINKESWDLPRDLPPDRQMIFDYFLMQFQEYDIHQTEFPNLEKLSLRFRLVKYEYQNRFLNVFLPWLRRLGKLKEFHLSQIYTGSFHSNSNIRNILPRNCHCVLENISCLLPFCTESLDDEILENELNQIKNKNKPNLLGVPNPIFCSDTVPPGQEVLGYDDSIVQFKTDKTDWTFRYGKFKSLTDIPFYTQNLLFLKEIKIQQCGLYVTEKIKITDADIQSICQNSLGLTHLEFEFSDLSDVTDFGLTGINPSACERMRDSHDYEIQMGDIVGFSLARLKELRILRLSYVGIGVTDVTAHHICISFPRGLFGEIKGQHNITQDGMNLISKIMKPVPAKNFVFK